jgi:uncharacterized membrane protein YeiH
MLYALDLIGVAVFGISGAIAAGRKSLDLIGVVVLSLVTAIGGGTIRDVLLDRAPIFWLSDPTYVLVITAAALLTVVYARVARHAPSESALLYADALGLALFSVSGAQVTQAAGLPAISGVVLGTVTGAAGGVVRDVLLNDVPHVLRPGTLYASAAIAGTSTYFILDKLGVHRPWSTLAGMLVVATVRLASIAWEIKLPAFRLSHTGSYETPSMEHRRQSRRTEDQ